MASIYTKRVSKSTDLINTILVAHLTSKQPSNYCLHAESSQLYKIVHIFTTIIASIRTNVLHLLGWKKFTHFSAKLFGSMPFGLFDAAVMFNEPCIFSSLRRRRRTTKQDEKTAPENRIYYTS